MQKLFVHAIIVTEIQRVHYGELSHFKADNA